MQKPLGTKAWKIRNLAVKSCNLTGMAVAAVGFLLLVSVLCLTLQPFGIRFSPELPLELDVKNPRTKALQSMRGCILTLTVMQLDLTCSVLCKLDCPELVTLHFERTYELRRHRCAHMFFVACIVE